MDITPALPPYGHLDQSAVMCIAAASRRYQVPELLMHAILLKENGRTGECSKNKNGTLDCGLAQINSIWTSHFQKHGISYEVIKNDACLNIHVSAYILRSFYVKKGMDWGKAIISYNIGPNNWTPKRYSVGYRYAVDVVNYWRALDARRTQYQRYGKPSDERP